MNIKCPCGTSYKLSEKFAGKRVKCKKCGQAFQVPAIETLAEEGDLLSMDLSNLGVPVERSEKRESPNQKRAREDALLRKFETDKKSSSEDFIAENFRNAFLEGRHDRAVYGLFFGLAVILLGGVLFWVMGKYEGFDYVPRIIWVLELLGGKFIVATFCGVIGAGMVLYSFLELKEVSDERKKKKQD